MDNINLNETVPNFKLQGTSNLSFNLSNFIGTYIVIYFYPKDSTPGCTNEGIDFKDNTESALARPYVIFEDNVWKMWFAHKGESYRLGYAESLDGINWERCDEMAGLSISDTGFDSEMVEYAAIVKYDGQHFMFYNGNNYGQEGIGLAVEKL